MAGPSLPEELLAQILWHLRPSIGPIRGLDYDYHVSCVLGPYSDSSTSVNRKQRDDRRASRQALESCMRASRDLRRLAQAVYYETVDVDQLLPFVRSFISHPDLAGHVRELYISGQNGYFFPQGSLFDAEGTSDYGSFRSRILAHSIGNKSRNGEFEVSVAMMALVLCIKLEKIVVHQSAAVEGLPEILLKDCAALFKSNESTPSRIPLSNLRTFAIQVPSRTDHPLGQASGWRDNEDWVQLLSSLPLITSIEIAGDAMPVWYDEGSKTNLTSLTIVDLPVDNDGSVILSILKGCPVLECLDLTAPPRQDGDYDYMETWSGIGDIMSRYGASLRKFRYDNILNQTPGLLNVSALRNLRYLAVPVDALMELDAIYENDGIFNGNRHGFGSVYDIEDMWAESIEGNRETGSLGGRQVVDQDDAEEWSTRCILAGSDVPFSHLFPDTLQHLRILDDVGTEEVASHIDKRLRDLALGPRFSELHDVQVRRKTAFTEHLRDIGWHIERRSFWNIMRRM
jgi:hypothetical protein